MKIKAYVPSYVVDEIYPPENWGNLTSDEVDKMIQKMHEEE
ncbi:hypothetical protein [Butyricicoccus intestinisimiae]|nr:hypothetical protein [Butyricicoccus intestinisimiae]